MVNMNYIKYILFQIRLFFFVLTQRILALFATEDAGENMKSGELVVIGKNTAKIKLVHNSHHKPRRIIIEFVDDCVMAPCNPKHHDVWSWDIHTDERYEHCHTLHINWHVSGVRTIRWTVIY
jgi:hypothetical protein